MGILSLLGRGASWFSNTQVEQHFAFTRGPLFMQLFDLCVRTFPDALDVQETGFATIPIYLFAGFIDYGIVCIITGFWRSLSIIWAPKANRTMATLADTGYEVTRVVLFLSFIYRALSFGVDNLRNVCDLKMLQWTEVRKLCVLMLMLCPALWCHATLDFGLGLLGVNREKPWLSAIFWYVLSGNWDVAVLRSGFVFTGSGDKVAKELREQAASSWSSSFWQSGRYAVIASIGESLMRYTPSMAMVMILAMQHAAQSIEEAVQPWRLRFQKLPSVQWYLALENIIISKRDNLVLMLVQLTSYIAATQRQWWTLYGKKYVWFCIRALEIPLNRITHSQHKYYSSYRPNPSNPINDTRRIRLLQIFPSFSDHDGVEGTLVWYDLKTAPPYTAISYVWDSSDRTSSMTLNDKKHMTTLSAMNALKGLRSHWRPKHFWIDAICINQDDEQDKAEQISFMSDIYKTAHTVVVWLGPAEHGALALGLVRRIWIKSRIKSDLLVLPYRVHAPAHAWEALRSLLQHRWFERSWVVQETLSSNVFVQYGRGSIDWITFSMFALALDKDSESLRKLWPPTSMSSPTPQAPTSQSLSKIKHVHCLEEFRCLDARMRTGGHANLSLLFYLIRMFRSEHRFKVTETKDRIYALVNLCGIADLPQFRSDYKPLHHKTFTEADLFTVVAHHLLTSGPQTRRLDILSHAGLDNNRDGKYRLKLRSWVPDWSCESPSWHTLPGQNGMNELLRHPRLKGILEAFADLKSFDEVSFSDRPEYREILASLEKTTQKMAEQSLYRATSPTLPNIIIHTNRKNLLEIEGIFLDRVTAIGPEFPCKPLDSKSSTTFADIHNVSKTLKEYCNLYTSSYGPDTLATTIVNDMQVFARTLLADLSSPVIDVALPVAPSRPASVEAFSDALMYLGIHYNYLTGVFDMDNLLRGTLDESAIQKLFKQSIPVETARQKFWDIHNHVTAICAGRSFGVTSTGMMCLLPRCTKVNDRVCLFMGADVPFVIRAAGRVADSSPASSEGAMPTPYQEIVTITAGQEATPVTETACKKYRSAHTLIGSAYVQGFMDGEGLNGRPRCSFLLR